MAAREGTAAELARVQRPQGPRSFSIFPLPMQVRYTQHTFVPNPAGGILAKTFLNALSFTPMAPEWVHL